MKKLFAFLFVAVLLTGCGAEEKKTDKTEETMDEVIEESMESSRIRSVEAYAKAVETTTITYITLNPDVKNITICTGNGPATADCVIDATVAGKESGETLAKKVVQYSGKSVLCESAAYDKDTGSVTVTNCTVGDDTKNVYSGNTTEGIKNVK